ncbi:MAG: SagB/ThcOx family dehydrogenase [Calditrichia bacterium]
MRYFNSAREYHEKTKYTFEKVKSVYREYASAEQPPTFKDYPEKSVFALPRQYSKTTLRFSQAVKNHKEFSMFHHPKDDPLDLNILSHLLYLTNGVTLTREYPAGKISLRSSPSASRLYPIEVYVYARRIQGLEAGLYYFHPIHHQLVQLSREDLWSRIEESLFNLNFIKNAPAMLLLTSVFPRSVVKFGERSYRYCLMEAGYVGENLAVAASGLDLGLNLIGDFADDDLNALLQIDGSEEAVVMAAPIGKKAGAVQREAYMFGMIPEDEDQIGNRFDSLITGIHRNSSHFLPTNHLSKVSVELPFNEKPRIIKPSGSLIKLPSPVSNMEDSVHAVIERRRSSYQFSRLPITREELSTLLYHLNSVPLLYDYPAYFVYVVVNQVENLENGVYLYHPEHHALELLKAGTYRGDTSYMTLAQDAVFNCSVAFFFSADFEDINIFSNRGYRYAHFNIGMLSENLYLTATALELGVRGIGNYFDDSINQFFNVRIPHENILGGVIAGRS